MGLPAFDMTAIEAMGRVAATAPRASTTVLMGPSFARHAGERSHRQKIGEDVDRFTKGITHWRLTSIAIFAEYRIAMRYLLSTSDVEFIRSTIEVHIEYEEQISAGAAELAVIDDEILETTRRFTEEAQEISVEAGRFLRKQWKKLKSAVDLRAATYAHIGSSLADIGQDLVRFVDRNSIPSPTFENDEQRAAFLAEGLVREPDVADIEERTKRLLRQFPKATAYLAR